MTGADHSSSSLELQSSMLAPGSSRPWLSSAPDPGSAAHGACRAESKASLGKEMDAPYRSSVICEDIMANPDLPLRSPSPTPVTTLCVNESLTVAPPPDNDISVPIPSTSPPDTVAIGHPADNRTPLLDVPSLPSPTQVLTTGPPLTSVSPVFATDQAYSSLDFHSAMLVPDAPFTSPHPPSTSTSDLGAVPRDEDRAGLSKDVDDLRTSLTIREAITAVPDLPPQSPSPPSATGVALTEL